MFPFKSRGLGRAREVRSFQGFQLKKTRENSRKRVKSLRSRSGWPLEPLRLEKSGPCGAWRRFCEPLGALGGVSG